MNDPKIAYKDEYINKCLAFVYLKDYYNLRTEQQLRNLKAALDRIPTIEIGVKDGEPLH